MQSNELEQKLSLKSRRDAYKRRYKRTLLDMAAMIKGELEHLQDEIFEPSSAIDSGAFHLIQESNRLKSLLEVDE